MTPLTGFNVLILDFPDACELRANLLRAGATVHVVSRGGALILARNRRIDAAFVGFGVDPDTRSLCEELTSMGVGQIIVTPGDLSAERLRQEGEMFPDLVLRAARVGGTRARDFTLH